MSAEVATKPPEFYFWGGVSCRQKSPPLGGILLGGLFYKFFGSFFSSKFRKTKITLPQKLAILEARWSAKNPFLVIYCCEFWFSTTFCWAKIEVGGPNSRRAFGGGG